MKLSVLIPAHNEEATLQPLCEALFGAGFPVDLELILIDDGSTDRTGEICGAIRRRFGQDRVAVLRNAGNRGKGACIQEGLRRATGDWVVIQDGDLEYDPRDLPPLLGPLRAGAADAVYGSRFLGAAWPSGMALPNWIANRLVTRLINRRFRLRMTDANSCYKMMPLSLMRELDVRADGFEWDSEITAKLGRRGCRVVELPIRYRGRNSRGGKKIRPRDFWAQVRSVLAVR